MLSRPTRVAALAVGAATILSLVSPSVAAAATPSSARPVAAVVSLEQTGRLVDAVTRTASYTAYVVYVVRWGDTLSGLAAQWCGTWRAYPALAAASGIANPDRIYAGRTRVVRNCTAATGGALVGPTTRTSAPTGGWRAPLSPMPTCSSGWGAPRGDHLHQGIDLPRPSGTPIRAAHAGTVRINRWSDGAGWYVLINHGASVNTVYMHLRNRSPLAVGTRVVAGQYVGPVGTTGHSSGPHLHFEVRIGSGGWPPAINAVPFLRARGITVRGC